MHGIGETNATASPSTSANFIDRTNNLGVRSTITTAAPTSLVSASNAAHTHLPKSSLPGMIVVPFALRNHFHHTSHTISMFANKPTKSKKKETFRVSQKMDGN